MVEKIKAVYSICWDVPSEDLSLSRKLKERVKKEKREYTKEEKGILEKNYWKSNLRQKLYYEVLNIATFINRSVFIFPNQKIRKVKNLIKKYRGLYKKYVGVEPDICLLEFHSNSKQLLQEKALRSLIGRLNKMLDKMDDLTEKISKSKRKIRKSELTKFETGIESLGDLALEFGIKKEVKNLLKIAEEKVAGLKE